jgi:hypothetical protein
MYPMPLTANNTNSLPTACIQFFRLDDLMLCSFSSRKHITNKPHFRQEQKSNIALIEKQY